MGTRSYTRENRCEVQLGMPWPDNGTHGTQSDSGHAQEQQSQNPGSPWLAAGHWRRTRLLIEGARYGCTSLSSEIPQPDGAATPGRTSTIAEGNRQDGRPKREVADNAEALGAELAERRYLRRAFCVSKGSDRIWIWCNWDLPRSPGSSCSRATGCPAIRDQARM